ncbi:hypothetical protein [Geomonas propionica]|uniref:Uncharacterized protein n=1 Tax=Geomonas propionica TaxID=2798582 RepID=A0ABS0YQR2_9BACT|nr:hypothetical protein [Geomonas propionica]MBJ6800324.1 hypothetical protein [Geomonas propionica]
MKIVRAREGWEEKFRLMAEQGDDNLLDEDFVQTKWDEEEWVESGSVDHYSKI